MGGNESTDRRLNNADETEKDDRELRTNEAGSSVTGLAVAGAVAAGAVILASSVVGLVSGSGTSSSERKTMKAPGRDYRIDREDFEEDPKKYFRDLRNERKT